MPAKRKRSSTGPNTGLHGQADSKPQQPTAKRHSSRQKLDTNPDHNADVIDGKIALRASPDADEPGEALDVRKINGEETKVTAHANGIVKEEYNGRSNTIETQSPPPVMQQDKKGKRTSTKSSIAARKGAEEIKAFKAEQANKFAAEAKVKQEVVDEWDQRQDPDGDEVGPVEDGEVMKREAGRPPPVNSDYLPLPWKGRLGFACLNTYLRLSNPPIFSSRTCRIASILEHRHPLRDPLQPEHATKNRPDKTKPASIERGQRYVEDLGLANAKDVLKMLRWNEKFEIRFLRLSSEMFPFASHLEYGYKLAPFASASLGEVGKLASKLGHRLTTHPGQFTQLGSPRSEVIVNAIRDLDYHDEMLSLLNMPPQEDRDAVMILHMGGTFGDKAATLDRFRENYKNLSSSVKMRLVLENDDVSWSVHDLLPICEELNIPLCLDFHHHNIIFDSTQLREGTLDIMKLYPRIKATWDRKNIRQKMHYSEPTPEAVTGRQRRKHNPRPTILPPCPNDMDLMIEAKDKEQAVFELMRIYKLPGWDTFNKIIPYERTDDNKPMPRKPKKKKSKKQIAAEIEEFGKELSEEEEAVKDEVPEEEVGMGGDENRVYWPQGMEEWLRPKKREVKKKCEEDEESMFSHPTPANFAARKVIMARNKAPLEEEIKERLSNAGTIADITSILDDLKGENVVNGTTLSKEQVTTIASKATPTKSSLPLNKKKPARRAPTTTALANAENDDDDDDDDDLTSLDLSNDEDEEVKYPKKAAGRAAPNRQSSRAVQNRSYAEEDADSDEL